MNDLDFDGDMPMTIVALILVSGIVLTMGSIAIHAL